MSSKKKTYNTNFVVNRSNKFYQPLFGIGKFTPSIKYEEECFRHGDNPYPNSERHSIILVDFEKQKCYFAKTDFFSSKKETREMQIQKLRYVFSYFISFCINESKNFIKNKYFIVSLDVPNTTPLPHVTQSRFHRDNIPIYFISDFKLQDKFKLFNTTSDYVFLEPLIGVNTSCLSTIVKYKSRREPGEEDEEDEQDEEDHDFDSRFPITNNDTKTSISMLNNKLTKHSPPFCMPPDFIDRSVGNDLFRTQNLSVRRLNRTQILFISEEIFTNMVQNCRDAFYETPINFSEITDFEIVRHQKIHLEVYKSLKSSCEFGGGKTKKKSRRRSKKTFKKKY